jgi:penicillin-insensitive murein endopeptidase
VSFFVAFHALHALAAVAPESQCFGTVGNGRIERSVKLPASGPNFVAYSVLGAAAGRTYVHSKVAEIVAAAYAALAASDPSITFVYGESGWPTGGRIRPHRTHQNGLSVDFFVPVRDGTGKSMPLPTRLTNKLGYDIEFDERGMYAGYGIDFPAIAEHLYQLHVASKAHGAGIALVIFDPAYLPKLFITSRGKFLQQNMPFMRGVPWVRHDEHYHVDFAVACKPNGG